jgi:hypothetical protein
MRKISIIAIAVFTFVFASCNSGGPEKVAEKWLTDFLHLDYESAEQYSTKETINLLKIFQALHEKTLTDSARNEAKKIKVDIKDAMVEGNSATVTYSSTLIPEDQTLYLVKENGEWLVQLSKTDMFKDPELPADPDRDPNVVADTTTTHVAGDTSAAQ